MGVARAENTCMRANVRCLSSRIAAILLQPKKGKGTNLLSALSSNGSNHTKGNTKHFLGYAVQQTIATPLWWTLWPVHLETSIHGMKNFSSAWISGSTNHHTSIWPLKERSAQGLNDSFANRPGQIKPAKYNSVLSYCQSLLCMDEATKERMRKTFDICFVMAWENIAFTKYPALYELKVHHGVDLGQTYKTKDSAKNFFYYIAEAHHQGFMEVFSSDVFYSILMDGWVDAGKIEDELIVILYWSKDDTCEEIRSCTRFFSVEVPSRANPTGLVECLKGPLKRLRINDVLNQANVQRVKDKPLLVNVGTDGAAVNISEQNGMRGTMQRALPWLF